MMEWALYHTIIIGYPSEIQNTDKYACFDFDGTLVTSKSKSKFIKNKDDWQFKYDTVKPILQKLNNHGFQIVIFTNQAGIQQFGISNWQKMLENIQKELDIKIMVFVALEYDIYRKPYPTMWNNFIGLKHRDSSRAPGPGNSKTLEYTEGCIPKCDGLSGPGPDTSGSRNLTWFREPCDSKNVFYCGDACGRKEDFSDSDLKFAMNCNMRFYTPEHIFINQPNNFIYPNYNVFHKYLQNDTFSFEPRDNELLIIVGSHCSGKTTFVNKHILSHDYVKYEQNSLNAVYFQKNARIVVDDTNGTIVERKKYIDIATQNNFTVRCIVMTCPLWLALHNSHYQYYISNGQNVILSDALLESYRDKFEYPEKKEGIDSIIKYYFVIDKKINLSKYLMFFI